MSTNPIARFYGQRDIQINFLIVLLSVFYLYGVRYGLGILNPVHDAWMMKHDWATHYLGWFFFRNEPWSFPLGATANYLYPVGTNVGFSDSIPLAAIFFKIFSPWLPEKFQYFGPWMFISHVLTGYFTLRLLSSFSVRGIPALVCAIFIVFNPVLLYRSIHPSLCAHWILIGSMWVYTLDPVRYGPNRLLAYMAAFFFLGCLINPYFSVFEGGFLVALIWRMWRYDKSISLIRSILTIGFIFGGILVMWYAAGFFSFRAKTDLGVGGAYGLYALNLNSLYNSVGWSYFFNPKPHVSWHQYEGFLYLGAGMLALVPLTLVVVVARRISATAPAPVGGYQPAWLPFIAYLVVITLFAITNVVTLNDKVLFTYPIFEKGLKVADIFRASGRYGWILYYCIFIGTLVLFFRFVRNAVVATAAVVLIFTLQVYDTRNLIVSGGIPEGGYEPYHPPLQEGTWRAMFQKMDRFVFYPPFEPTYVTDADYRYFCYLAADYRKPINLGYAARLDNRTMTAYADSLRLSLSYGDVDPRALYITTESHVGRFLVPFEEGKIKCARVDGYFVLYPAALGGDEAFSALTPELPGALMKNEDFTEFAASGEVVEERMDLQVEQLERSRRNIFVRGYLLRNKRLAADLILRTSEGKSFVTSARATAERTSDTLRFGGAFFTDNLRPGPYQVGVFVHALDPATRGGQIYFFGSLNIGAPNQYEASEASIPRVRAWIDKFEVTGDMVRVMGWAFVNGQSSANNRIEVIFKSDEKIYEVPTDPVLRPDVSSYFNSSGGLETCGFTTTFSMKKFDKGSYDLGIRVVSNVTGKEAIEYMGRSLFVE